jgi:hypothetical protein
MMTLHYFQRYHTRYIVVEHKYKKVKKEYDKTTEISIGAEAWSLSNKRYTVLARN